MSFATFFAAVLLTARVIAGGPIVWLGERFVADPSNVLLVVLADLLREQFFVDSFNVFLVALTAFVGFTTALFSRPYMRTEQDLGRVNARRLRLYHSMYQLFTFTMLLCLLSNNVGVLWVAMEGATLSTVLLVSLYRTPASLEAAWKYFILCSVGLAQALFGTILLYFAAEKVLGPGGTALLWTHLHLRVRHGLRGGGVRGALAHDRALAHQERDLLHRRSRLAGRRDAEHGLDPRPDPDEPDHRLGPGAREPCDPRPSALRRVHERVHGADDRDARALLGDAFPAGRARRRLCVHLRQGAADGVR